MGYTVELEADDLRCKSEAFAQQAAQIINASEWISPYHLIVAPWPPLRSDLGWALAIEHFQGDHWHEDEAHKVWLAIAPCMSDGATLELQGEDLTRWRIRWEGGRVFKEHIREVIWAVSHEIVPELEEEEAS